MYFKKLKKNTRRNKKGGNCLTRPSVDLSNFNSCIPNVDVSQYKYPCMFLPLDGPTHNIYPLSNNPSVNAPQGIQTLNGGKRRVSKNNKSKRNNRKKLNNKKNKNKTNKKN